MSAINPLGSTAQQSSTESQSVAGMTQNDFLQLLIAQLKNQDPMNPVSSDQFLQEMASFTEVVDLSKLSQTEESLLGAEAATQGLQLLGRTVTAVDPSSGQSVSGTVSGLTMQGGEPMLTIGSQELPLNSVVKVS